MASGGLLRIEALGRVRRADVAFKLHREKWKTLLEECEVVDAQVAAHGMDEGELALAAGAIFESFLALGGGNLGELGVDLLRRGLGRGDRRECERSDGCEDKKRQWFHVAHPSHLFSQQWHKPPGGQRRINPVADMAPLAGSTTRADNPQARGGSESTPRPDIV